MDEFALTLMKLRLAATSDGKAKWPVAATAASTEVIGSYITAAINDTSAGCHSFTDNSSWHCESIGTLLLNNNYAYTAWTKPSR